MAIACLISGAFAFFAPQIVKLLQIRKEGPILGHDLALYVQVGSLGMFFGIMQTCLASMLRFLGKPYHYVVVQLSHILPMLIATLVFVTVFETGVLGVFLGGVVGATCGFCVAFCCRHIHLSNIMVNKKPFLLSH